MDLDWDLIVQNTIKKERERRRMRELVDEDFAIEMRFRRMWLGEISNEKKPKEPRLADAASSSERGASRDRK